MIALTDLIDAALQEDIGPGDVTTGLLVGPHTAGRGVIVAKEPLVLAGLDAARQVFARLDPLAVCKSRWSDGQNIEAQNEIFEVSGTLCALLQGERTALNFLQHLSGIATTVRGYVETLKGLSVRLVDTRKTTPGWRVLEKYAVRVGGACNHRMGLFDGILIKDNHIAVSGGVAAAVRQARQGASHLLKIEVEVCDLQQVHEALAAGADVIMLDNMSMAQIEAAVDIINGRALVEVSGGVTRSSLRQLAELGVDIISSGALTHSARAVDMSMRIEAG